MIIENLTEAKYVIRATSKFCDGCSFNVCNLKDRCQDCMMDKIREIARMHLDNTEKVQIKQK